MALLVYMAHTIPLLRDHALRFDPHVTSEHEEVEIAVDWLLGFVVDLRKQQSRRINDREGVRIHIKLVVLNLFAAYKSYPYVYRAVSRRAPDYSKPESRYLKVRPSLNHMTGVMDDLQQLGYACVYKGMFDRQRGKGYTTRICAEKSLIDFLEGFGVEISMLGLVPTESIRLRNSEGDSVDYVDTDETERMRRNLARINGAIRRRRIHLAFTNQEMADFCEKLAGDSKRPSFDLNAVNLVRIFNNSSFSQGGRFYGGWWQNVPRDVRPYIEIDYGGTVEVDYSGIHIRLLYALADLECPEDPYDLPTYPRESQKQAVLTIINADSRRKALGSLKGDGIKDAKGLCDALCERHRPIARCFFSGMGTDLQFLDSQIAETVMLKMIALGGIALPIHDSFIVRASREDELKAAMNEAFNSFFPNVPSVHKRKESLYEMQQKNRIDKDGFVPDFDEVTLKLQIERMGPTR